jgi:uncharacterized membrane protein YdjX (TVP38/TMEM64 family)
VTQEPTQQESAPTDTSTGAIMARLGPAAVLGVLWAVLPAVLGLTLVLKFRAPVADWLQEQDPVTGLAIYVGVFAITAGFGLLPTVVQALIGGYAFGLVWGIPGALAGVILASLIGYVISRLVARHKVEAEIERHPKARAVREALVGGGPLKTLGIVTLIRVPPNSPFALTNLVLTSVEVRLWIYAVGTAVGMAPRTVAVVWMGTQVSDWDSASKPGWLLYGGIGLTVVVLMVLGHLGNKAIERVTQPSGEDSESPAQEK